jgi:hypothetical protein
VVLYLPTDQSTRCFIVDKLVKALVCKDGVYGEYIKRTNCIIRRVYVKTGEEHLVLESAFTDVSEIFWILLDPEICSYVGVDMILLTSKVVINWHVKEIVGINVTLAMSYKPMASFLEKWTPLARSNNVSIQGLFITHDGLIY